MKINGFDFLKYIAKNTSNTDYLFHVYPYYRINNIFECVPIIYDKTLNFSKKELTRVNKKTCDFSEQAPRTDIYKIVTSNVHLKRMCTFKQSECTFLHA